jgi:hypothetical protein
MSWFWLNIPLATLFFLAWTLIPLWLVLKHPEPGPRALTGAPAPAGTRQRAARPVEAARLADPDVPLDALLSS